MKRFLLALLFVLPVMGCQSLGLTSPQNLDQRLAYSYSAVTAALNTIAQATTAGQLKSADAVKANQMVLQAKDALDLARAAEATDASAAVRDLSLATAVLTAVQRFLTQNGVK